MSYLTYTQIPEGSAATPGLWHSRFDEMSASVGSSGISSSNATFGNLSASTLTASSIGSTSFRSGVLVATRDGIDVIPGSNTSADLISVGVSGAPKMYWDHSLSQFVTSGGGWFINGTTNIVSGYISTFLAMTGGTPPATGTSTGEAGQIVWSGNTLYICASTNSWRRIASAAF